MNIIFRTDENILRAVGLYQTFGPPGAISRAMVEYPWIFGRYNYDINRLNHEITLLPHGYFSLFSYLFDDITDDNTKVECARLIEKMQHIIYLPEINPKINEFAKNLRMEYANYNTKINNQIKSIFDFDLPQELYIVINSNFTKNNGDGGGIYVSNKISAISLGIPLGSNVLPETKHWIFVLIHELLHVLIRKNNKLLKTTDWFEEALLDYFVPNGIISNNFNETKLSVEESFKINIQNRPYSEKISKELLPIMKKYAENIEVKNIWQFLEENGFGKYINH